MDRSWCPHPLRGVVEKSKIERHRSLTDFAQGWVISAIPSKAGIHRSQCQTAKAVLAGGRNRVFPAFLNRAAPMSANRSARKSDFSQRHQGDLACPVGSRKIFDFTWSAKHRPILACPVPQRGALRDRHGRWVRDAVDTAASSRASGARTNDAIADGEVVWS
jgi:hypothetical protein